MKLISDKLIYIIGILALMGTSFLIGLVVNNWPLLEFDTKISISDVFSAFVTIILALTIPYFIKVFIERSGKISEFVHEEIRGYKFDLETIQQRFVALYQSNSITERNKAELMIRLEISDNKLESLISVIENQYGNSVKKLTDKLITDQIQLWQQLTGSIINEPTYTRIEDEFFRQESLLYQDILEDLTSIKLCLISK